MLLFCLSIQMTVADILVYADYDFVSALIGKEVFQDFPKLSALRRRVGQNDKISDWVAKRPPSMI